jgi:hypothetical protein
MQSPHAFSDSEIEEFKFSIAGRTMLSDLRNIRVFVIDVSKPTPASRA